MTSAGDGGTRPLPSVGGPGPAAPRDNSARRSAQDEQATTVIGRVEQHRTGPPPSGTNDSRTEDPQSTVPLAGRALRGIEVVSGLLGGGLLLAGLVLLVLQFAAPALVTAGRGPGWAAVTVHLAVGLVAEVLRAVRGRFPAPVRWALAAVVIVAAVGVLLLVWW